MFMVAASHLPQVFVVPGAGWETDVEVAGLHAGVRRSEEGGGPPGTGTHGGGAPGGVRV